MGCLGSVCAANLQKHMCSLGSVCFLERMQGLAEQGDVLSSQFSEKNIAVFPKALVSSDMLFLSARAKVWACARLGLATAAG